MGNTGIQKQPDVIPVVVEQKENVLEKAIKQFIGFFRIESKPVIGYCAECGRAMIYEKTVYAFDRNTGEPASWNHELYCQSYYGDDGYYDDEHDFYEFTSDFDFVPTLDVFDIRLGIAGLYTQDQYKNDFPELQGG